MIETEAILVYMVGRSDIYYEVVRSYSKIASSGIAIDSSKNMLLNAFWILWGYPCYQGPPPKPALKHRKGE